MVHHLYPPPGATTALRRLPGGNVRPGGGRKGHWLPKTPTSPEPCRFNFLLSILLPKEEAAIHGECFSELHSDKNKLHSQLEMARAEIPMKDSLTFRYAPALLFVNLQLPDHNGRVADTIFPHLKQLYSGNELMVSVLN